MPGSRKGVRQARDITIGVSTLRDRGKWLGDFDNGRYFIDKMVFETKYYDILEV